MINISDLKIDLYNFINSCKIDEYFINNTEEILSNYISKNYLHKNKIYGYSVKTNYPEIEIVVIENINSDFIIFKLIKFERLQKIRKLKFLND